MQGDSDVSDNSNDSDFRDDKSVTVQQLKGIRSQPPKNRLSDVDLASLERDSERLARKAQKRLNRSFDGRSESMIEKFVGWHRKKKLNKVKVMLASLFPKLKHSEDEVKAWVQSVTEEKEAAMITGRALLFDVEHQIALYQNHLEFLDEVVNDVRQLDYDVVREIGELKVALHFNQELLRKSKSTPTAHATALAAELVKPETLVVDEPSYNSGTKADDGNVHLRHSSKIGTTAFAAPSTPVAEPAVWQGIKHGPELNSSPILIATSPFTRSLSKLLNRTDSPRNATPAQSRSSFEAPPKSAVVTIDISENHDEASDILSQQLVWDGAESKRKLLNNSCVSLQSLSRAPSIETRERSNSSELPRKLSNSNSSGESFFTSIFQRQTSFSGSSTTTNASAPSKDEKEKSFQRSTSVCSSLNTANSRRYSTGSQQEATRHDATPMRGRADSNSSHVSSSSDASSRASVNSGIAVFSNDAIFPATKVIKKYKNNGLKLSSLLQILPDDVDQDMSAANDSDQEEMIRRINKCLVLKEILKSILHMIQETQETENDRLKKIKKLRIDLKIAIVGDPNFVPSPPSLIGMSQTNSNRNSLDLRSKFADAPSSTATPEQPSKSTHILNAPPMVREVSEESMSSTPDFISHLSQSQQPSHEFKRWTSETSNQSEGSHSPSFLRRGHPTNPMMIALHSDPHYFSQESHDSLSMASTSSPMADGGFQEAAGDFIDDLKALVWEEKNAKEKLAILSTLIDSAASIDSQLSTIT
jgi:hypothetical protein